MAHCFAKDDAVGTVCEIAPGVTGVNAPFWGFPNTIYVIESAGRLAIVDTGIAETPAAALDAYIHGRGGYDSIDLIVGTHAHLDHIGGNAWFAARAPHVKFALGAEDVGWAEEPRRHYRQLYELGSPGAWQPDADTAAQIQRGIGDGSRIDIPLYGGEDLRFGGGRTLRAIALGAHTRGQTAYLDTETGCLFTGDAIQGAGIMNDETGTRDFPMFGSLREYRRSIERILATDFVLLCTAHAGVYEATAGRAFAAEALAFAESLVTVVAGHAARLGDFSLEQLVSAYLADAAEYADGLQIRVTLSELANDLVAQGRLQPRIDHDGEKRWAITAR